jgi:phenylalanyl-tRNA synthetase beta chain
MPIIEVSYADLCSLIGKKLSINELKEKGILFAKGELEEVRGDLLKIDIKDTNRPDLWSAEGVAREIKFRYGKSKFPEYKTGRSGVVVHVDRKVRSVRPFTVCAVVKNLNINDHVLSQIIQLQEKVAGTFGRNRREVAIGIYDLHKIKSPIKYTTVDPYGIRFVPLDFDAEMTPAEILKRHPKGKEFCHLLGGCSEYPMFIDSDKNVLSIPPIINSDYTGKVTEKTKDVFIECSGFDLRFLMPALNVIVAALADRGGRIETVKVVYPDNTMETPDLRPKKFSVDVSYINKISGLNLTKKKIIDLLEKSGYRAVLKGNKIDLSYPAYRQDIMHQRDVIEDVIISFGYDKISPEYPKLATVGCADGFEIFSDKIAEIMIGLGLQEVMSYNLTNKDNLFKKMNLKNKPVCEIANPISANWNVFRNWLMPSLLEFLSNNRHVDYPQTIFEIGDCVVLDEKTETKTRDVRKLAVLLTDNIVNYEQISSYLDVFFRSISVQYKLRSSKHPSFIEGRVAEIFIKNESMGVIGEIHPRVLNNWGLEKPVVGFEIDIQKIRNLS